MPLQPLSVFQEHTRGRIRVSSFNCFGQFRRRMRSQDPGPLLVDIVERFGRH